MDMIQEVVRTEREQKELISSAEADYSKKIAAKKKAQEKKFEAAKRRLLDEHENALDDLKKSFAAKRRRQQSPSLSLDENDRQAIVEDVLQHIRWQLKE